MSIQDARIKAIAEAEKRLMPKFPETFEGFKRIVAEQPTVEQLNMMKEVAFRGWEKTQ